VLSRDGALLYCSVRVAHSHLSVEKPLQTFGPRVYRTSVVASRWSSVFANVTAVHFVMCSRALKSTCNNTTLYTGLNSELDLQLINSVSVLTKHFVAFLEELLVGT